MNRTLSRLLGPRFGLYFLVMIVFAAITALLGNVQMALGEAAVVLVLYLLYLRGMPVTGCFIRRKRFVTFSKMRI